MMHLIHFMVSNLAALVFSFPDGASGEVTWTPPVAARPAEAPPPATETDRPSPGGRDSGSEAATGKLRKHASVKRGGARNCKRGKKGCKRGKDRPEPVTEPSPEETGLLQARQQRDQVLGLAQPLVDKGRRDDAVRVAASAAEFYRDPVLYLAAAEFDLADPQADQRRLARADRNARTAGQLLALPTGGRIAPDEVPRLSEGTTELARYARSRQERLLQLRRSKAELVCGSVFLAAGAAGAGMLVTGAVMSSRVRAIREYYAGENEAYLALLDENGGRAKALLAAGAAATVIGAAIGIPLTVAGKQERRRAREGASETPSFRVVPSVTSVSITGKF